MSRVLEEITKRNQMLVDTMAYEIKYICEQAQYHDYTWNEFKQRLLIRIEIEETWKDITDI